MGTGRLANKVAIVTGAGRDSAKASRAGLPTKGVRSSSTTFRTLPARASLPTSRRGREAHVSHTAT
jgi:hypothetical protein